jgi:SulP family sulfate permease
MSFMPRPSSRDVIAGVGVALILIPQSMAYANLAGLPARHGLFAAALGPLAAGFFASSPYLQTGPVALTALLTLGALIPVAAPGTAEYVGLAALLALVVGIVRVLVGTLRGGWISYLMSRPMLDAFAAGAGILIVSSQLPGALGVEATGDGILSRATWVLLRPAEWEGTSSVLAILTLLVVIGARRLNPLIPAVLIATVAGVSFSLVTQYSGVRLGDIDGGLPSLTLALPWAALPTLVLPGIVIALVGFAEAASISRIYATKERMRWNPNQEFIGQGAANIAVGLFGGFPIGGSFSRSSLNYLSGARTRWSGLVTGVVVLAFLPFAKVLSALPSSVLSAIVIAAVVPLIRVRLLASLWRISRPQAVVGWLTFGFTIILSPHIEQAVVLGILAAVAVHIWRELEPGVEFWVEDATLHVKPSGVLWFGSAAFLEEAVAARLAIAPEAGRVVLHLDGLGRIDLTGAQVLRELMEQLLEGGLDVEMSGVPPHAVRILDVVNKASPF